MPVFCLQFSSLYFPNFSLFSSSSSMTAVYSFPIVTLGYCVQHASLLLLLLLLLVFTLLMLLTLASSARALVHTMANFS